MINGLHSDVKPFFGRRLDHISEILIVSVPGGILIKLEYNIQYINFHFGYFFSIGVVYALLLTFLFLVGDGQEKYLLFAL
jgi:hypothetical protein